MILRHRKKRGFQRPHVRVSGGVGVLAIQMGDLVSLRAFGRGGRFAGSWKMSLAGDQIFVLKAGYVNGLEPLIGEKFISGKNKDGKDYADGPPALKLEDEYDETGRSWLCLRVLVNADGKLKEKDYTADDISIVQSRIRVSPDDKIGLHPLAILRRTKNDTGWGTLRQISYFDLQHGVSKSTGGKMRHWFFPA